MTEIQDSALELGTGFTATKEQTKMADIQIVLFELADIKYGVNVNQVQGVIDNMDITKVPNSPFYVEGVTNLRGEIIPVIDLRKKFNIPERDPDKGFNVIIVSQRSVTVGFTVDKVNVVMDISGEDIDEVPDVVSDAEEDSILGVARNDDYLIVLIDLLRVVGALNKSFLDKVVTESRV